MTVEQTAANVVINYVKPLMDAHPEMTPGEFKPHIFGQMVQLLHEKRIDTHKMRRWLEERVGEKAVEETLRAQGVSQQTLDHLDQMEVYALVIGRETALANPLQLTRG
jgi:hypothetical protein